MKIEPPYGLRQRVGLFLGPIWLLAALVLPPPSGLVLEAWYTAGATLLMATWWIAESIPIPATSLLLSVPAVLEVGYTFHLPVATLSQCHRSWQ
ncbi:MAG: hypothetical protein OXD43_09620 [Bacteroidetes bacterium]|nr:hypothetical protein [Bacteroidota bacterium]